MKIRIGFVTNSSSTNFLIISKKELTSSYLLKKLGVGKNSKLSSDLLDLVEDILRGVRSGPQYYDIDEINYDTILELFGKESAEKYKKLNHKGYHTYIGYTCSESNCLTAFMTVDHFIIDDKDFYMNGESCGW